MAGTVLHGSVENPCQGVSPAIKLPSAGSVDNIRKVAYTLYTCGAGQYQATCKDLADSLLAL